MRVDRGNEIWSLSPGLLSVEVIERWKMVSKPAHDDLSGVAEAVSELPQTSETSWCRGTLPRAQYGAQPADRSSLEKLGRPTIPPYEVARRFRGFVSAA
jgi:hypothetical protein